MPGNYTRNSNGYEVTKRRRPATATTRAAERRYQERKEAERLLYTREAQDDVRLLHVVQQGLNGLTLESPLPSPAPSPLVRPKSAIFFDTMGHSAVSNNECSITSSIHSEF